MEFKAIRDNEDVILGLCLNGQIEDALNAGLKADNFFDKTHREIFLAMYKVYLAQMPIDITTVGIELQAESLNRLLEISDKRYTGLNLIKFVIGAKNMKWANSILNAIRPIVDDIVALKPLAPIDHIQGRIELLQSSNIETKQKYTRVDEGAMQQYIDAVMNDIESGGVKAVDTGIKQLNQSLNGGMKPGNLITIAARPGLGKTALATNIAYSASKEGYRVQYFTVELGITEIIDRLVCIDSGLNTKNVACRVFNEAQMDLYVEAMERITKLPITIHDDTKSSWETVEALIRAEKRLKNLNVAIVDYVQQFRLTTKRSASKREELTEITGRAKELAKELGIAIIIVAQLNRAIDSRANDSKPKMSDLKESGSIEQDSDFILILYNADNDFNIYGEVVKNRAGNLGTMLLRSDLSKNKFYQE